jgi:hypothetical protein
MGFVLARSCDDGARSEGRTSALTGAQKQPTYHSGTRGLLRIEAAKAVERNATISAHERRDNAS